MCGLLSSTTQERKTAPHTKGPYQRGKQHPIGGRRRQQTPKKRKQHRQTKQGKRAPQHHPEGERERTTGKSSTTRKGRGKKAPPQPKKRRRKAAPLRKMAENSTAHKEEEVRDKATVAHKRRDAAPFGWCCFPLLFRGGSAFAPLLFWGGAAVPSTFGVVWCCFSPLGWCCLRLPPSFQVRSGKVRQGKGKKQR